MPLLHLQLGGGVNQCGMHRRRFRFAEFLRQAGLGLLHGLGSLGFVNVIRPDGHIGEHRHAFAGDLHKAVAHREENILALFAHGDFAGGQLRHHRLMAGQDAHVASLENRLRERLGTKVHLRYARGKGALEISFFSDDELERILTILGVTE